VSECVRISNINTKILHSNTLEPIITLKIDASYLKRIVRQWKQIFVGTYMSINNIIVLLISNILFILTACSASRIPTAVPAGFVPHLKEIKNCITGRWMNASIHKNDVPGKNMLYSGELIAVNADSIFILTSTNFVALSKKSVDTAILYLFINPSGAYAITTAMVLVPNVIGAIFDIPFLILGIPWFIVGSTSSLIDALNSKNILEYPEKNTLEDFGKYARFPMGIPKEVNRSELTLILKK
jgi:hypothetical protein